MSSDQAMDSEINYQNFKEKHAPSLLGATVRGESPSGEHDELTAPGKEKAAAANTSLDDDDLDELTNIERTLAADKAAIEKKLQKGLKKVKQEATLAYERRESAVAASKEADDDEADANANANANSGAGSAKSRRESKTPLTQKVEYFHPHDTPTPNEIVEKVNEGEYESKKKAAAKSSAADDEDEEAALDKMIAAKLHLGAGSEPSVPDSTIENDAIYVPPAAMMEGSSSRLLQEQRRSRSRGAHSGDSSTAPLHPHLAHGESYHGGVKNDDYYSKGFPIDDLPKDGEAVERKPRHDPNAAPAKAMHVNSLNYLRSLSSSRSRADNDKRQQGYHFVDETDLKDTGGLVNDDNFAQNPDLDDAVNTVLNKMNSRSSASTTGTPLKHATSAKDVEEDDNDTKIDDDIVTETDPDVTLGKESKEPEETTEDEPEQTSETTEDVPKETEETKDPETKEPEETEEPETKEPEETEEPEETKEPETKEPEETKDPEEPATVASKEVKKDDDDDMDALFAAAEKEQKSKGSSVSTRGAEASVGSEKLQFEDEPVWIYTSLAGGMQVMSRTNRLTTILTANKIKFGYKDLGTDAEAKKVWKTYAQGKTLPGVVRGKDDFIGDWKEIDEANENYEVRSMIYDSY